MRVLDSRNPYFAEDPKIVVWKMDPETLRLTEVSGKAERLLGFAESDWLEPHFWQQRIHRDEREDVVSYLRTRIREGRNHELEYRALDKSGNVVWIHDMIEVTGPEDARAVRGMFMDITHRVRQEEDVARAFVMQQRFLRLLGDEFAAPLSAASDFGELLERHLARQGDDVGSDYALGIREGLEKLARLSERISRGGEDSDDPSALFRELIYGGPPD